MAPASRLWDSPSGYGSVTRALHWGMAALFAWQFAGALLHLLADKTAIERFFWNTHFSVGFTLWLLVLVRGAWGLANLRRRPAHEGSARMARAAKAGHLALYALMVAVPSLAILRAVGGTRGFTVYGIQLSAPRQAAIPALTAPGNALHSLLGWVLLALVVGHVVMALYHARVRRDGTLERMTRGALAP
ncbi:MAG: cytochrome b [Amaricoccus sp.]|uniref:cytochrome b n=1 Tax=Amaricoccus sp. TaxID=1872485 RepID=UPI0039E725DE